MAEEYVTQAGNEAAHLKYELNIFNVNETWNGLEEKKETESKTGGVKNGLAGREEEEERNEEKWREKKGKLKAEML